jgi:hypothetical protein
MASGACHITKQKENRDCVNTFCFNLKAKLHVVFMNELELSYQFINPSLPKKFKNPNALKRKKIASVVFKLGFSLIGLFPNFFYI